MENGVVLPKREKIEKIEKSEGVREEREPDSSRPPARATDGPGTRMEFLDGLRGFAALYVVIHHIWADPDFNGRVLLLPRALQHAMSVFTPGSLAVSTFIVLSGYCLMMPVARSADLSLRGGALNYIKRRAHRILPPYYAAFALTLVMIACVSDLRAPNGQFIQMALTDHNTFAPSLVSHLFLFHNINKDWAYRFNGPLWSVATEWQIYFLLPGLLLPICRKFGIIATVLAAYCVGWAPHYIAQGNPDAGSFWFVGLFAMGMAAATITFSTKSLETRLRETVPWGWLAVLSTVPLLAMCYRLDFGKYHPLIEMYSALPVASLLVYFAKYRDSSAAATPIMVRILESKPAFALGAMSYSIYLTHMLVIELMCAAVMRASVTPMQQFLITLPVDTVLALALGYGFHSTIERRFMPGHFRRRAEALARGALTHSSSA
jgi:peptidoglycan/LPS O-acetylase OafA/YrhL